MKQPSKNKIKKIPKTVREIREITKIGTSNLEVLFAEKFLDKLRIKYVYQWVSPCGKVFDFAIPNKRILIEIQGDYYHKNPLIYEKAINQMQIKNVKNDKIKAIWAVENSYTLLVIWEHDIHSKTKEVMKLLKEKILKI